jgi:hypothetical protein
VHIQRQLLALAPHRLVQGSHLAANSKQTVAPEPQVLLDSKTVAPELQVLLESKPVQRRYCY